LPQNVPLLPIIDAAADASKVPAADSPEKRNPKARAKAAAYLADVMFLPVIRSKKTYALKHTPKERKTSEPLLRHLSDHYCAKRTRESQCVQ
jgi:hypothetical protein